MMGSLINYTNLYLLVSHLILQQIVYVGPYRNRSSLFNEICWSIHITQCIACNPKNFDHDSRTFGPL